MFGPPSVQLRQHKSEQLWQVHQPFILLLQVLACSFTWILDSPGLFEKAWYFSTIKRKRGGGLDHLKFIRAPKNHYPHSFATKKVTTKQCVHAPCSNRTPRSLYFILLHPSFCDYSLRDGGPWIAPSLWMNGAAPLCTCTYPNAPVKTHDPWVKTVAHGQSWVKTPTSYWKWGPSLLDAFSRQGLVWTIPLQWSELFSD